MTSCTEIIATVIKQNVSIQMIVIRSAFLSTIYMINTTLGRTTSHRNSGLTVSLCAGIESEWRKTQCSPREVCIDVGREFGAPTNVFYKPPCVSVYRCGGCCHSEDKQCRNISTGYLSKNVSTLFYIF